MALVSFVIPCYRSAFTITGVVEEINSAMSKLPQYDYEIVLVKTNEDSREVQTETLTIKASPLPDGKVKAKTGNTTDTETYNNWYKSVYLPAEAPDPEPDPDPDPDLDPVPDPDPDPDPDSGNDNNNGAEG